jgi:phosphate transport system permease protein
VAGDAYTGQKRRKQTPWSVKFGDAFASRMIAVGGIGTIAAILLVVLVLLGTALPLLKSPTFDSWRTFDVPPYTYVGVDETGALLWGMDATGQIEVRNLIDGSRLASFPLEPIGEESVTCTSISIDRTTLALGFSNGTFRTAQVAFETRLYSPAQVPEGVTVSQERPAQPVGNAVYQWLDRSSVRETRLAQVNWSPPRSLGDAPLLALDYIPDNSASRLAQTATDTALAVVGPELVAARVVTKQNRLTKKSVETITVARCPLLARSQSGRPVAIALVNGNKQAVVGWENGTLDRFALVDGQPQFVESQRAVVGTGQITAMAPLLARQTVLCGLDNGQLQGWMIVRRSETEDSDTEDIAIEEATEGDGYRLALAHEIKIGERPLVSVSSSEQTHVAVTGDDQGNTALVYVTTDRLLSTRSSPLSQLGQAAANKASDSADGKAENNPENDLAAQTSAPSAQRPAVSLDHSGSTLIVSTDNTVNLASFDIGYPEASVRSYFGKVWYEGHTEPKYIWQSSSGTEKAEIKISLMPLVFGTLKATVYAMIISVPLAILAAIYTSEFLSPSTRGRVKPVIELMASLPSVVLGYIAALVIAPYLQEHLLAVLMGLLLVPLTFVAAGNLWNLLPVDWIVRLQPFRLLAMAACLPLALFLSVELAEPVEYWLFDGSLVLWLGSDSGSATGGWMLLLLPLLSVAVCLFFYGPLAERTRQLAIARTPQRYAILTILRFVFATILVIGLAWAIGSALSVAGLDLRGNLFDSYQDRNALLVGAALGFCVIPIIYTISDDALQAVPSQLRSASLGCGATPWQTTMRVVVPSAMSGLFSAVMIGLGRAVGETMVVLMAAGNTPVMEWNPFNGFRTLSATLATELPEAAKGSTHFRTLFLAALLLFFLTLIANTFAEYVRIRFRKRASQL